MALRSVVLEAPASPPAPRRTIVVRAGGPAPQGRLLDVLVGIVGALLLVTAIALGQVLPDKTFLNPQFRLTLAENSGEGPGSQAFDFLEAGERVHEFAIDIDVDNVKSVTLEFGYEDDLSYSRPDRFDVDLFHPNGTQLGHVEVANPPAKEGRNATDPPTFFLASERTTFATAPPYSEQIVTGLTHTETAEQVLARLEPQVRTPSMGTWIVRVTLIAAEDCPAPGEGYASQAYHCRFGHPNDPNANSDPEGVDLGNRFLLANFQYTFYTPEIQELK